MRTYRNMIVTTICHTRGVASALQHLFSSTKVVDPFPFSRETDAPKDFARLMSLTDAWIDTPMGGAYYGHAEAMAANPSLVYVLVPSLEFDVFHPDLCSVNGGPGAAVEKYTSRIAAWAYSQSIPPANAAKYFNAATFANLGYLSRWDRAVARMRRNFDASDLKGEFDGFYRRIKRAGQFMYTQTHPKPFVIAELAKLIAVKLGHDRSILDLDIPAHDKHAKFIWPLYPEIARNFSLPTSGYFWKIDDETSINGLEAYIQYSYNAYQKKGIAPSVISIPGTRIAELGAAMVPYG